VPRPHLERDGGRDERERVRVSKPEPPRHVTNGLARRPTATNGAENLAYNALDAR
jgi:hypothetical protein